jgi:hypothetical protein
VVECLPSKCKALSLKNKQMNKNVETRGVNSSTWTARKAHATGARMGATKSPHPRPQLQPGVLEDLEPRALGDRHQGGAATLMHCPYGSHCFCTRGQKVPVSDSVLMEEQGWPQTPQDGFHSHKGPSVSLSGSTVR